jgi:TP901 family phage tail tape measure protein
MGPDKLAKAMFLVESAGQHGADGLKVMQAAAEGAKIGGADATVVADGLTTAMTDYKIKADDAAKTTSMLVATVAAGKSNMGALAGSLSAVLPAAAAAGVGLNQVLGAMATMTGQGISAQQSAQDLAGMIRNIQKPSGPATAAMAAMGLSSLDLAQNLGKNGLTGTMEILTKAITAHMGPAGLVLQDSFNQSKLAAKNAHEMLGRLPQSLQKLGQEFMDNKISQKEWAKELKGQPAITASLGKSFAAAAKTAQGFTQSLKNGSGSSKTFSGIMSDMTGGANGLGTALALGGANAGTFNENVKAVGKASAEAGGHVHGWAETQKDFKVQIAQAVAGLQVMAVTVGDKLIPMVLGAVKGVKGFVGVLTENPPLLYAFAAIVGGVLVVAIGMYIASLINAGIASAKQFAGMVKSGVVWIAQHAVMFATATAQGAVWVAKSIAQGVAYVAAQVVAGAKSAAVWVATGAKTAIAFGIASAAMIAQKAVLIGSAVATGVATAAQWLFNAALDANPIGIVIVVLAALVAAIVWVATKTTFFQTAWKVAVAVVGQAVNWLWTNVISPVATWIGDAMHNVGVVIGIVFGAIAGVVSGAFSTVQGIIRGVMNGVVDLINGAIGGINTLIGLANKIPGVQIGLMGKLPHFDVGGPIPGAPGTPLAITAHGGEYMLSRDMLAGRASVPRAVSDAIAPTGRNNAQTGAQSRTVNNNVTVHARTDAKPNHIATTVGWELKQLG